MNSLSFIPEVETRNIDPKDVKFKLQTIENLFRQDIHKVLQLFEKSDECIFITCQNGDILSTNTRFALMLGYSSKEEIVGQNMMKVFDSKTHDTILDDLVDLFEHGLFPYRKRTAIDLQKRTFPIDFRMVLLTDSNNNTAGLLGIFKKRSSTPVNFNAINNDDFNAIFNHIPSLIFVLDKNINVVNVNDAALQIAKKLKEDAVGIRPGNILNCVNSYDSPKGCGHGKKCNNCLIRNTVIDTLENGKTNVKIESPFSLSVGEQLMEMTILVSSVNINGKNEPQILVVIDDITDRKKTEQIIQNKELELKKSNDNLQQLNEQLYSSYQDIQRYNVQLKKAKEKAEQYDKLKTAFLANISHEIRTPLNGILGFTELLTKPGISPERKDEYYGIIKNSSARLLSIMNDLIEVAQIETGDVEINNTVFSLKTIFLEVIEIYHDQIHAKGLTFSAHLDEKYTELPLRTDKEKLLRIFFNLINNAIKFTSKGNIETGVIVENDKLTFYVKDTGPGIPNINNDDIFDKFKKGKIAKFETGVGIGLYLSKSYIELLGGRIWVESLVDKGTSFYFSLPKHNYNQNSQAPSEPNNIDYADINWQDKTVLIVEDEEYNVKYLKEILKKTNAYIVHAATAALAIDLYKMLPHIDIILLDIKLPDSSGYEVAKTLRDEGCKVKIIAQTAYAMESDRDSAIAAGCNDYMSKPIKPAILIEMLQKYLA